MSKADPKQALGHPYYALWVGERERAEKAEAKVERLRELNAAALAGLLDLSVTLEAIAFDEKLKAAGSLQGAAVPRMIQHVETLIARMNEVP